MTGALRVATVPDRHPYLDAVLPADVQRVQSPPGPDPWAPSRLLQPGAPARAGVDVVHVHFGYESLSILQMQAWAAAFAAAPDGPALVVTVHDLRNPHESGPERHDAHLAALLPHADAVITLTDGAAAEIEGRWGRTARVVAHPSLLTAPGPDGVRGQGPRTVGVHLKSLRTNLVDPAAVVRAVVDGSAPSGAGVRVDVHPEAAGRPELAVVRDLADAGRLDLRVHGRFDDADLIGYLQAIDVSVLPHRFGTHSGWLELCRDLGTAVVAPDCGYYAQQWPAALTYANNERDGLDAGSLSAAVSVALTQDRPVPADRGQRHAQVETVRAEHAAIYRAALAHRRAAR